MKDFHDVWALSGAFAFGGLALQRAIAACFERRRTPWTGEMPECLASAFYMDDALASRWRSYRQAGAVLVAPPEQFEEIAERIINFIGPVRTSIVAGERCEHDWSAGGRWSTALVSENKST